MESIPKRPLLVVTTLAWVMVAKAVNSHIPYRLKPLYQQCLCQRNPNVINSYIQAIEIVQTQVDCGRNGFSVLCQPIVKRLSLVVSQSYVAFSGTCGNSLAHIYWRIKMQITIKLAISMIENGIDTSSYERLWRKRFALALKHCLDNTFANIPFIQWIKRLVHENILITFHKMIKQLAAIYSLQSRL